jgi:hypothetical protein
MSEPCSVCRRCHRGRRCLPIDKRSVSLPISFPGHVARELRERVPWGERSGYVARLVAEALEADG